MPPVVTPCLASLFQGDHLGVEFALESHSQLLYASGALHDDCRLQNHQPPPLSSTTQALVIDDLVSVSAVPSSAPASFPCLASELHDLAQKAYRCEGVAGSPEKDVSVNAFFRPLELNSTAGPALSLQALPLPQPLLPGVLRSLLSV